MCWQSRWYQVLLTGEAVHAAGKEILQVLISFIPVNFNIAG
jgi:hypothetical protein